MGGTEAYSFDHRPIWLLGDVPLRHVKSEASIESPRQASGLPRCWIGTRRLSVTTGPAGSALPGLHGSIHGCRSLSSSRFDDPEAPAPSGCRSRSTEGELQRSAARTRRAGGTPALPVKTRPDPTLEALSPIEAHSGGNGAVPRSGFEEWMPWVHVPYAAGYPLWLWQGASSFCPRRPERCRSVPGRRVRLPSASRAGGSTGWGGRFSVSGPGIPETTGN